MSLIILACAFTISFSSPTQPVFSEEWFRGLPPLEDYSWDTVPDCVEKQGWLVTPDGFPEFDPLGPSVTLKTRRLGI